MKALIYDLEIVKAIPSNQTGIGHPYLDESDIEYCGGWHDYESMGISCLCAYDYHEDRYRVFTEGNKGGFADLIHSSDLLVGFNNIKFDNNVIRATWGIDLSRKPTFDILLEIWRSLGFGDEFNSETHAGYGLDAMAKANFGIGKTGFGGNAPVEWQKGNIGSVIDYCLMDIKLTKMLFDKILYNNCLKNPKDEQSDIVLINNDLKDFYDLWRSNADKNNTTAYSNQ